MHLPTSLAEWRKILTEVRAKKTLPHGAAANLSPHEGFILHRDITIGWNEFEGAGTVFVTKGSTEIARITCAFEEDGGKSVVRATRANSLHGLSPAQCAIAGQVPRSQIAENPEELARWLGAIFALFPSS